MAPKLKIYGLLGIVAILAYVVYFNSFRHSNVTGLPDATAGDTPFVPLDIHEPQLRLDLLARIQKSEYSGSHRNVFVAAPPPPPKAAVQDNGPRFVGPKLPPSPPPPPPLQIPGEFFGYAFTRQTARRIAFFKNGDDVQLLAEGDVFLGSLRLIHIGDNTVDVQEISSGRHTTVQMVQPALAEAQ